MVIIILKNNKYRKTYGNIIKNFKIISIKTSSWKLYRYYERNICWITTSSYNFGLQRVKILSLIISERIESFKNKLRFNYRALNFWTKSKKTR